MATETGPTVVTASRRLVSPRTSLWPLTPPLGMAVEKLVLQLPSLAVYAYEASEATFTVPWYAKPASMRPPPQPLFALEQSTSCCSERDTSLPVAPDHAPSVPPVVENAQQDPHWPWFFTAVTRCLVVQSTEATSGWPEWTWLPAFGRSPLTDAGMYPSIFLYSSADMAAKGPVYESL